MLKQDTEVRFYRSSPDIAPSPPSPPPLLAPRGPAGLRSSQVFTSLYLRRFVAVLFVAVLLVAAASSASELHYALTVPLAILAVAILFAAVLPEGGEPEIHPLAFLCLVISRAPPVV